MGLANDVIKEIGNRSREFYEFVLPPVDMHLNRDSLKIVIDIPGFSKKDIKLVLCGDILSIKAQKETKEDQTLILSQRPYIIDKKIRLPIKIKQGEEEQTGFCKIRRRYFDIGYSRKKSRKRYFHRIVSVF